MSDQPDFIAPGPRTGNDRIIVSVGVGRYYRDWLRSTVNHCAVHCSDTWRLFYDSLPEGSPAHSTAQYAFKIHALRRVVDAGFRYVLWMDTHFQPVAPIDDLWRWIELHGWYVALQGDSVLGQWASDQALRIYGISREKAMSIPLVYSGIVGLDLKSRNGLGIWGAWKLLQERGAFNGPHYNAPGADCTAEGLKWRGHCSFDPRCSGHRHDEAALSFVLHAAKLKPVSTGFLTLESEKGIIGHCVPDYDVIEMRRLLVSTIPNLEGEERRKMETLCR